MLQDLIHKLSIETCAKNFFLYKIDSIGSEEGQLLSHIFNAEDYISGFVTTEKEGKPALKERRKRAKEVGRRKSRKEESHHINVGIDDKFEECHRLVSLSVYFTWFVLTVHAYFREFLRNYGFEKNKAAVERQELRSFAPLMNSFEAIYARNCYMRVRDVFERPICGVPGATVKLVDRQTDDFCWTFKFPGTQTEVINAGSYNYLGFAQKEGPCADAATRAVDLHGLSTSSTAFEIGQTTIQSQLELLVAEFLGVEAAVCFSMGFATNSMNVACLVDKDSLIVSDQYNHSSLILGSRLSGASIRVFRHNDMHHLERVLRDAIALGNPKTGKPFNKILVAVEGIYSMEGSICQLPAIIALKRKYSFYLYLDEAHSIGATGRTGRGVVEHWGCDPLDVDVLMGTFTKSFGAAGGYLAGKKVN